MWSLFGSCYQNNHSLKKKKIYKPRNIDSDLFLDEQWDLYTNHNIQFAFSLACFLAALCADFVIWIVISRFWLLARAMATFIFTLHKMVIDLIYVCPAWKKEKMIASYFWHNVCLLGGRVWSQWPTLIDTWWLYHIHSLSRLKENRGT